jgi:hypothetical protein
VKEIGFEPIKYLFISFISHAVTLKALGDAYHVRLVTVGFIIKSPQITGIHDPDGLFLYLSKKFKIH